MAGANLKTVTGSITKLPTLPEVAMKLICVANDPDSSGKDVANLLTTDPALVAQVLKLINSSYFGLMEKISNVHRAVNLLGMRQIRNLALGASVIRAFGRTGKESQFDLKAFWLHSIAVARVSEKVARMLPATDPEQAYVVGLLHDMGKLILHQFVHNDFNKILASAQKNNKAFCEVELSQIECTHADLAAWLVKQWDLEEPIVNGIQYHHTPDQYGVHRLAGVCRFANYICQIKFLQCPGSFELVALDVPVWEPLELTQSDFFSVLNEADKEIQFATEMLQSII